MAGIIANENNMLTSMVVLSCALAAGLVLHLALSWLARRFLSLAPRPALSHLLRSTAGPPPASCCRS